MVVRHLALAGVSLGLGAWAAQAVSAPAVSSTSPSAASVSAMSEINAPYASFLSRYISMEDGIALVEYGAVTAADHQVLKTYIADLAGLSPSTFSRDEALAYWFNLYNAKTLDIVLDHYPVTSIKDIGRSFTNPLGGPWKQKVVTVEGRKLSLDNIEHDTVRATYDEPRVHYAFNCASIGCPNLKSSPWTAETLDTDLDSAARAYIAHPRGLRIEDGEVTASSIYKWFQEDFGGSEDGVLDHVRAYATGAKAEALSDVTDIDDYAYDWSLNDR
ncbi:hypothetical protein PB2503_02072 [Parvularcula bermudensis HTCC2503]|uniref:DUF547 domain-containing protein n=1 Tax=Parvularcula bermudensis (strain ATCC BAA-594 / HTCC2503 / KCTC 12087) TaxID=314260 RepID=E0TC60_PARBH|nr:DUF547 domain-containing protein [Parvularcula bermudensis]ADM08493.1 hypothetical protein PB2503_02072 [Parvularcula bermudensis HTCC2503]